MSSALIDHVVAFLEHINRQLASKFVQFLDALRQNKASAATAAVAGFAIAILVLWRFGRGQADGRQRRQKPQHGTSAALQGAAAAGRASLGSRESGSSQAGSASQLHQRPTAVSAMSEGVRRSLGGAQRVTCHLLGVVLQQRTPAELAEGATLLPGAGPLIQEVARHADLYLMAMVEGDASEVAILSALEDGDILGSGSPVNPIKVLFCSTETGIMSFVRQLEPDLHIDSSASIVEQLKRFVKWQLHIAPARVPGSGTPNVSWAPSLDQFLEGNKAASGN